MYKFIDLFAGIGGIRMAFERQGCECVFTSEWDAKAQETYHANFGEWPHGDITQVQSSEVPDHDILLAGFPCQPFSVAGVSKKKSLGRKHGFEDETQGTLFFDLARIIRDKQPKAFLLENVKNLKSHDKGNTYRTIMRVLQKELGYWTYSAVLDAKGLVPQHRERIYIVGFREPIHFEFPELPAKGPSIKEILQEEVPSKYTLTDNLWKYLQDYAAKHKANGNGFGYGLVDLESHTRTLSARYYKDGSEILIPQEGKNPRRLTPRECARLQGFPDDYQIVVADTSAYKQFGNSVSVPVVEKIAEQMMSALGENKSVSGFHRGQVNLPTDRDEAITRAEQFGKFYCKFISPDDIAYVGGNRTGIRIQDEAWSLLFDEPGQKGENKERQARIYWEQLNLQTECPIKWQGKGSRNEYKITKLGKGFPYISDEYIGDLFVLIQASQNDYLGYVFTGNDADVFLEAFSISPVQVSATHGLTTMESGSTEEVIERVVTDLKKGLTPRKLAEKVREIYFELHDLDVDMFDPAMTDEMLLAWADLEYRIFKQFQEPLDRTLLKKPNGTIYSFIRSVKASLKSWKGHFEESFQHHLEFIASASEPRYRIASSREKENEDQILLECQAFCRKRSKQQQLPIEEDQMDLTYLATIERTLSFDQLSEMKKEGKLLVVPQAFHELYPEEFRGELLTVAEFCGFGEGNEMGLQEPVVVGSGSGE